MSFLIVIIDNIPNQVRRPAIQKQFYDIEERVIIRPAGSALIELKEPTSQLQKGPAFVQPLDQASLHQAQLLAHQYQPIQSQFSSSTVAPFAPTTISPLVEDEEISVENPEFKSNPDSESISHRNQQIELSQQHLQQQQDLQGQYLQRIQQQQLQQLHEQQLQQIQQQQQLQLRAIQEQQQLQLQQLRGQEEQQQQLQQIGAQEEEQGEAQGQQLLRGVQQEQPQQQQQQSLQRNAQSVQVRWLNDDEFLDIFSNSSWGECRYLHPCKACNWFKESWII